LREGSFGSRGLRHAQRAFFSDLDSFMAELPSSIYSGRLDKDPSGLPVALSNVRAIHDVRDGVTGLNRSRGRTPRLAATRQSNRRRLIVTSGAINPLLAMIR
jgi:hypothetical protein